MAPKILEAELRISASDRTAEAFERVDRRTRRLRRDMSALGGVIGRELPTSIGRLDRSLGVLGRAQAQMKNLDRVFSKSVGEGGGLFAFTRGLGFGIAQMTAYTVAAETAQKALNASIEGQHERVRMEAAGMSPGEINDAQAAATDLSAKLPALSQSTILHMLRNARSIVGSYEEAAKLIEPLARLRVVVMGGHPERAEELEGDFDKIQKAQEIVGVTQDPARFTKDMNLIAKAMNVFGDTLRPYDFFEFAQRSRQAGQGFSDEFLLGVGPTLMQHMGGAQAGTAMAALFQQFLGGHMSMAAARMMEKYNLLDPSKVEFTKAGLIKHVDVGALKENNLAKTNPYRWVNDVLLPALRAGGVTTKAQIGDVLAVLASKSTTGQALGIFATQQQNIDKDVALEHSAPGLEAADTFMNKDVTMAWQGLEAQITNFMQIVGGPLAGPAAQNLNSLAHAIGEVNQLMQQGPPKDATGLQETSWYARLFGKIASATHLPKPLRTSFYGVAEAADWVGQQHWWGSSSPNQLSSKNRDIGGEQLSLVPGWARGVGIEGSGGGGKLDINNHVKISFDTDLFRAEVESIVDHHLETGGRGSTGDMGQAWPDVVLPPRY